MYNWNEKHGERSEKVKKNNKQKHHHLVQDMRFPYRRKGGTVKFV